MTPITTTLTSLFKQHRLVFWYDPAGEMRGEYLAYEADGVEKVEAQRNEFGLKHRMMREAPQQRFLVYLPFARPAHSRNWLLDLELSHHVFHADGVSLILQEFGWQEEHRAFVESYREYFNSKDRRERLQEKLHADDEERDWRLKMLSVLCREVPILEGCVLALLSELADGRDDRWQQVVKFGLEPFFWDSIGRQYDYRSASPTLMDFVIEVFLAAAPCGRTARLGREAKLFLARWKDSNRYREAFETLSRKIEDDLGITASLNGIEGMASLLDADAFEAIERKIIVEMRDAILGGRISLANLKDAISRREVSYWFGNYRTIYAALLAAMQLTDSLRAIDLGFGTLVEGVERYTKTYWRIDQLYRHFHYNRRASGQATLLDSIREEIDRRYTNDFLLRVGDKFQGMISASPTWPPAGVPLQDRFYREQVAPVLSKGNKLFVIVSDALRYEIAEELHNRILKEDRFRSQLGYHVSMLPSYTQLGMAALLPHEALEIDPASGEVRADGQRTNGLEARKAILAGKSIRATAVKAQEFLGLNTKEEGRVLTRDHDLIYIYQNGIDHVGDKRETEVEVFDAAAKELDTLIALLKKVAAVNGNNVLITADHGFLFQQETLEESDFTQSPGGEELGVVNRRFAFARRFEPMDGSQFWQAKELGLAGDYAVAIPKSINRYRKQGSGARYVHGGASLQEIVVPVLTINKARKSDTEVVEVDVIRSGSSTITTSHATISFYQEQPAKEKQLARCLRVGFYSKQGDLLSDQKELVFDAADEDPRLRERKERFVLGKAADRSENQNTEIVLRMEEKIKDTNQYRTYKEFSYRLKKAFESDFE